MSNHEANKVIRVLKGERLKYTVRVHKPDDTILEFQSNDKVQVKWNDNARQLWIHTEGYEGSPVCVFQEGMVILQEQNPDWVDPTKP